MALRVMVVDDESDVRGMVRVALRLRPNVEVVGEAASGRAAAALAAQLRPDAIVLDLHLPDIDARKVYLDVHSASPSSAVVVYTALEGERRWFEGRDVSYVRKDDGLDALIRAIEHVAPAAAG